MTNIKLCGLRRLEDMDYVNAVRPDFAGVILADPARFHRAVSMEQARAMRERLSLEIPLVGVFVNDPMELVEQYLNEGIIDMAQLHGSESEEYIRKLQTDCGKPVIKAFKIQSAADVEKAVRSSADHILLDSGTGSGKTFDWSVVAGIDRPFLLAGGLNPENLERAIAQVHPWSVDMSSGTETDGVKDPEKMKRAVEIAHA